MTRENGKGKMKLLCGYLRKGWPTGWVHKGAIHFLINTPLPSPHRKKESQAQNLFSNYYYYYYYGQARALLDSAGLFQVSLSNIQL